MRPVLSTIWLVALLVGMFCTGLFLQGVIRDERIGDPDVSLDLSRHSRGSSEFRPWRGEWYDLAVSSVNHAPPFGVPFRGKVEIRLVDATGREVFARTLDSVGAHTRASNMSWTQVDSIRIARSFFRRMTLSARVVEPDSSFASVATRVHLRTRQYDPGMGGMMNYVMLAPAILSLTVAAGVGANMSGRGWGTGPLRVTFAIAAVLGAIAIALR